ncbi:MAG: DJ-1/PfpI family protein [Actinomycetota bacterium]|nr:DJ-1/PfpI family protein [Actinomycetota bacterium]
MTTRFGIFIFDGVEELDFAGPYEVLSAWARYWADDDVEVFTFARTAAQVRCAKGLQVIPHYSWETTPEIDVLVYPGGQGNRVHLGDPEIAAWLHGLASQGALMTSVCTGALVYADVGLLDGRPATTHWLHLDEMVALGTGITARPEARFVDDGDVVTAAGVSAGIDMALHLIARCHSVERAREVRRIIQYDPEPPV